MARVCARTISATALVFALLMLCAAAPSVQTGAYWCPMHPDVRASEPGKCPRCGMTLMPMPPTAVRYVVDFETTPDAVQPGRPFRATLVVHRRDENAAVTGFEVVHEKLLHLFIVSQDFQYFSHLHPDLAPSGSWNVETTLPSPGVYHLFADFLPSGGTPQIIHRVLVTAGSTGGLQPDAQLSPSGRTEIQDGLQVELALPRIVPGRRALVTCHVLDVATGARVTDLEPYLGARGHLLVLSQDFRDYVHSHPAADDPEGSPSDVVFDVLFPRAGLYKLWAQFQRRNRVTTVSFVVAVGS